MLFFFIRKYLRRLRKAIVREKNQGSEKKREMQSPCIKEIPEACSFGCCPVPLFHMIVSRNTKRHAKATTARISRSNFAKLTTSSVYPNVQFTNHESLPPLPDAFSSFISIYPQYGETQQADSIRESEYYHLYNHACLDYVGLSLFSYAQMHSCLPSSSSGPPPSSLLEPPFFSLSYKSASLKSQVQYGNQDNAQESAIRKRIMHFLNISSEEYSMVCTVNRTTAFRLLAESYSFCANKKLLSVYDHESEALNAMTESAQRRGAKVSSASFSWPSLRIHSGRLTDELCKKKRRGMFVFPLQSRISGARYPYLWMRVAKDNGWQVLLDACALGAKDMDTLGLSLIQPDFIICSFFKVFGENPSGFAGLFIKKSSITTLESSTVARSIGIVSIIPTRRLSNLNDDYSGTDLDAQFSKIQFAEDDIETTSSLSSPVPTLTCNVTSAIDNEYAAAATTEQQNQVKISEQGESSNIRNGKQEIIPSILELELDSIQVQKPTTISESENRMEILCKGLDHVDSLGLVLINKRLRCIVNWLVIALMKLQHPHSKRGMSLVRIYGPQVKFDRGPALAFNVFDWKGKRIEPGLVQKLADRSNISLSCGFLHNILFAEKYEGEKDQVLETRTSHSTDGGKEDKENTMLGINVLNASLSFLTNFEDAYRLWSFIAKFLDADYVEKEKWRYMALNQKMIEI